MSARERWPLYEKAIKYWGIDFQIRMLAEESAELAVASLHLTRQSKPDSLLSFIEEIADVEIMIEQMMMWFNCRDEVETVKEAKILKLTKIIEGV